MGPNAIVFALANPVPEIDPEAAATHAAVVATGRSDFPNQINNVLAFPGVFRGLLETVLCTALPQDVLARPDLQRRIERLGDEPLPPTPGPDRDQLLALLAA